VRMIGDLASDIILSDWDWSETDFFQRYDFKHVEGQDTSILNNGIREEEAFI
jgi:hypothetical protein